MLEESGLVVEVSGKSLWIEVPSRSPCSGCAQTGCGSSLVSKMFNAKANRFKIENSLDAQTGDRVVIGISDEALVRASLAAYLLPLCTMLIMPVFAQMAGIGAGFQSLAALCGLALGFLWLSRSESPNPRIRPRLLRIDKRRQNVGWVSEA
ncbi:MAG: SoxR reducing system RseC family protein [Gammaproteobacteria bacterium]